MFEKKDIHQILSVLFYVLTLTGVFFAIWFKTSWRNNPEYGGEDIIGFEVLTFSLFFIVSLFLLFLMRMSGFKEKRSIVKKILFWIGSLIFGIFFYSIQN